MNMPLNIMEQFRDLFLQKVDTVTGKFKMSYRRLDQSFGFSDSVLPANTPMRELVLEKEKMNKLMQTYIDRVRADPNTFVKQ